MSEKSNAIPPPPRLSLTAVASLICGLLGWFILPAFVAIVTGIIGLRLTRQPNVRGRGMAMGGLVLGSIFGVIGIGVAVVMYQSYTWHMEQVRTRVPLVVNAAAEGDYAALADTASMTADEVNALREHTAGWGKMTAVTSLRLTGEQEPGHPDRIRLSGEAMFEQAGARPFDVVIEAKENRVQIARLAFR